jgi:hypothetical protein
MKGYMLARRIGHRTITGSVILSLAMPFVVQYAAAQGATQVATACGVQTTVVVNGANFNGAVNIYY